MINSLHCIVTDDPLTAEREARAMTVPPSLLDPLAEQSAVMGGLEKFTDYNITVLCFTDPGDGLRSQPFEVRTNEDGKMCFAV
jgi:protein sidekick